MKHHRDRFENALSKAWQSLPSDQPFDTTAGLNDLHSRIEADRSRKKALRRRVWAAVSSAACVLLLMVGEYCLVSRKNAMNRTTRLVAADNSKGEYTLPDGTHVWLNSGATLEYDGDFLKSKARSVRLDGEAFFDVARDGRLFTVEMDDLGVVVHGTRFNARHDLNFDCDEVTLVSGSVGVTICGEEKVVLEPGQQCVFNHAGKDIDIRYVDTGLCTAWTSGSLEFDNTPLGDIMTSLSHWYNVRMIAGPGINNNVRLSFKVKGESLEETAALLSQLSGYHYKIIDRHNLLIAK